MKRFMSFDWAMKKLLRSKANFGILEGFLSELLFEDIKILEVLESESNKETRDDKFNRVDLKVKDENGKIILIEVQLSRQLDYMQRILYGASKSIVEHINESEPYSEISKIISVNILYFIYGEGDDYIYKGTTQFYGMHNNSKLNLSESQKKLYDIKEVKDIFPEYYLIEVRNFDDIARSTLDEWIYFLKNEEIKGNFKAKGLKEAEKKLQVMKMSESERRAYEAYQEDLHQQASMFQSSFSDGMLKGREEGLKKGEEEGRRAEKIEIARNMLNQNIEIRTIVNITGLSIDYIKNL